MNRNGGKSITEMIQRAAKKAIKQGEAGLGGKRSLAMLLDELMQNDVQAFLKTVAPYVPREVVIDQTISITSALIEAQQRVIDMGSVQVIDDKQVMQLSSQIDPHTLSDQSDALELVAISQGGVQGGAGAE